MKKYFSHLTDEELKRAYKKVKENFKNTRNGRPKKFFLSSEYVTQEDVYDFLIEQNKYTDQRIKEERKRAWEFLNDEEETIKAGWYDKKTDPKKLEAWAEKAYPNINVSYFETEFEEMALNNR